MSPTEEKVLLSWKAPRYKDIKSDIIQDVIVFGLMGIFFIVGIIRTDLTIILIAAIAAFTIHQFSHKTPPKHRVEITNKGVRAGEDFYPYSNLESFGIIEDPEHQDLILRRKQQTLDRVDVYIGREVEVDVDLEELRKVLKKFLKEKDEEQSGVEMIARWLGY